MTRTDIHAPTNLITEDYEFVGCGNYATGGIDAYTEPTIRLAIEDGWHFGENHSAGDCYHCGARLTYYAVLRHLPTHTLVRVGETCLGNRFELATAEFHRLRKRAQLDRQAQRVKSERLRWFAVNPDREDAFTFASEQVAAGHFGSDGFYHGFVSKVNRYGSTTDKYVQAIMRAMAREERIRWEREMARAMEPAPTAVVEGRIEITGKVLAAKLHENDFGSRFVMTVLDDRGFKVWGTIPASLTNDLIGFDYYDANGMYQRHEPRRDARVRFTAMVERSERDETFGFFKRPSKAEILDAEPAEQLSIA